MKWIESYNLIEMFDGDYGNQIVFDTADFSINDLIIVVFENDIIEPKIYLVDEENYKFNLSFTKEEISKFNKGNYSFSIKQYRNNQFLDTILNGTIRIKETNKWEH